MATETILQDLLALDASAWRALLQQFFSSSAALFTVIALPSTKAADDLAAEEQRVVQERLSTLSEEELNALEEKNEEAQKENETPIPPTVIETIAVPSMKGLFCRSECDCVVEGEEVSLIHGCDDATMNEALKRQAEEVVRRWGFIGGLRDSGICYPTRLIQFKTEFAKISAIFSTQALTVQEKRLLPVLLSCLEECPQRDADGSLRTHEEVIDILHRDTVSHSLQVGVRATQSYTPNRNCEGVSYLMEVEGNCMERCLELMENVLVRSVLDADAVHSVLSRVVKLLDDQVHSGDVIAAVLLRRMILTDDSTYNCLDYVSESGCGNAQVRMKNLLTELCEQWDARKEQCIRELEALRQKLVEPNNIQCVLVVRLTNRLCISAEFRKFMLPSSALFAHPFHKRTVIHPTPTQRVQSSRQFAQSIPSHHGVVCGMKDATTASFTLVVPHISESSLHERLVVRVAKAILAGFEGPLWRAIRGKGLSYDFDVY